MNTAVEGWVATVPLTSFGNKKKLLVEVNGEPIALFRVGNHVYAFHDVCVHKQRSLSKGTVLHCDVICPGHQWKFDLETGYNEEHGRYQPTYDIRIHEGTVYVSPTPRTCEP